jgi:ABC-type antimicrobial peptide transport system permease subunit
MVIKQGMVLLVIGMVVGLVGAYLLANVLASALYEVEPRDPAVFVAVAVVLTVIAFLSVAIPAARASRVSPITALRYE